MRNREDLIREFVRTDPSTWSERTAAAIDLYQRDKIMLEVMLDIREALAGLQEQKKR